MTTAKRILKASEDYGGGSPQLLDAALQSLMGKAKKGTKIFEAVRLSKDKRLLIPDLNLKQCPCCGGTPRARVTGSLSVGIVCQRRTCGIHVECCYLPDRSTAAERRELNGKSFHQADAMFQLRAYRYLALVWNRRVG